MQQLLSSCSPSLLLSRPAASSPLSLSLSLAPSSLLRDRGPEMRALYSDSDPAV